MTVPNPPLICSNCDRPMDAACGGRGYTLIEDAYGNDLSRPCPNVLKRRILENLGPEIASVQGCNSPLYQCPPHSPVVKDYTTQNLLLVSTWPGLLPHFKWALYAKGQMFRFRVVTDNKIKTVFVGDDQYRARPTSVREDMRTFNNLEDLVGDLDLVILKLGYLGHKNAAAAGALKEALLIREVARKPTWVIEDTRVGYEWHHSRSPEVEDYLERHFERMELAPADPGMPIRERREDDLHEVEGMSVEDHEVEPPPSTPRPARRVPLATAKVEVDVDLERLADGVMGGEKKPKFKRKGGNW